MSAFVQSFRRQAEHLLAQHPGIPHTWTESSGDWVHLEILPDGPNGFIVHVNVGPEYALVIASRTLSREFRVASSAEEHRAEERACEIVAFLSALLSPATLVRERRAGRATYLWTLEREAPERWQRVAAWRSVLPWRYVGRRCEVVYQNQYIRSPQPAG